MTFGMKFDPQLTKSLKKLENRGLIQPQQLSSFQHLKEDAATEKYIISIANMAPNWFNKKKDTIVYVAHESKPNIKGKFIWFKSKETPIHRIARILRLLEATGHPKPFESAINDARNFQLRRNLDMLE